MELLNEQEYQRRLEHINQYFGDEYSKTHYTLDILKKYGQTYKVRSPADKRRLMKAGSCYYNAVQKMKNEGLGYVEGLVTDESGLTLHHAWNVNDLGEHIDYTHRDPQNHIYTGIIIPDELVRKVGMKNGGIWYCVLPFLQ